MMAGNLFSGISRHLDEEAVDILAAAGDVRIERIVSKGHTTKDGFWYDQEQTEWVLVVCGRARLEFQDRSEPVALGAGDHLVIPAHVRHRVVYTDPDQETIWLAVHYREAMPETPV